MRGFYPTLANPTPPATLPLNASQGYSQTGTRLTLNLIVLDPILPSPVRDHRQFDFAPQINDPADVIQSVSWSIGVMPNSRIKDPDPQARLFGDTIIDGTGQKVSHLIGDCIAGVVYQLTAQIGLTDGRVLLSHGQMACDVDPSGPTVLANGAITFNYGIFIMRYPEFKEVSQDQVEGFWDNACLIFRNDFTSPEPDPRVRQILLMCLTAHICALFGGPQGGGGFGPQITGPINSKSVGSVSLSGSSQLPGVTGTQSWYLTTRYGTEFWKKTAAYRTFHYIPGPTRFPPYSWTPGRWIW